MKFEIQLVALVFILLLFILVTYYVKKNKISVKYSITLLNFKNDTSVFISSLGFFQIYCNTTCKQR